MSVVRVQRQDFDAGEVIAGLRRAGPGIGAVATFIGLVRDVNDRREVSAMTLEHYPGMTEKALEGIVAEAERRWDLIDVAVVHRVGELRPTDQIVLVAVASAHRQDAFQACEFIMDYLKTRAPFWKKESTGEGGRWVASRRSDAEAAGRWKRGSGEGASVNRFLRESRGAWQTPPQVGIPLPTGEARPSHGGPPRATAQIPEKPVDRAPLVALCCAAQMVHCTSRHHP